MKRERASYGWMLLYLAIVPVSASCKQEEKQSTKKDEIYVAANVWPSCHYEERTAEILWPEGMGEWEVIRKGTPRFEGEPVYSIFNFPKFVMDFGGLEGAREALDYFREKTMETGFPGLHLQVIAYGGNEKNLRIS